MFGCGREGEIAPARPFSLTRDPRRLARPHPGLIADPTDKVADAPIIVHTNGKAEHTFGNLPQAYKFTLSVSAQAPSGRWSEPQSAKLETAMGCAPPAPPSFGGKGMETNLYSKHITHDRVVRVVALSGGYSRVEANRRLTENTGMIASFSRALTEGLSAQQSDDEFDATLDQSIEAIFQASRS